MTRIDFHVNAPDKLQYGCRLVRKIHRAGSRVVVWSDDRAALARFDELLWTFSAQDFIPHVAAHDRLAAVTPVLLASEPAETPHHDVLVNLGGETPPMFSRFERLIEVICADDDDRARGRQRWRFYRDRGYPLETHDLGAA